MAGGAWFAHFRAPVLISPFQNHLRNGLRRAIVTWGGTKPAGIDPWMTTLVADGKYGARLNQSSRRYRTASCESETAVYSMNQTSPLNPSPVPAASLDE